MKSLDDLRPKQLDQVIEFFEQYNKLYGKKFRHLRNAGPKTAAQLLRKGGKKR